MPRLSSLIERDRLRIRYLVTILRDLSESYLATGNGISLLVLLNMLK